MYLIHQEPTSRLDRRPQRLATRHSIVQRHARTLRLNNYRAAVDLRVLKYQRYPGHR